MMQNPSIALVGPGAIGCTLIAHLAARGFDLTACVRTPLSSVVLETPEGKLSATPRVWTDPSQAKPVDWVLVATKTYNVEGTVAWLARLVGPGTRVAIIQNGVEHRERFGKYVREESLVPVIIDCPVERSAPGVARQRGRGTITVPADATSADFVRLFDGTPLVATATDDWKTAAWRKLCQNAAGAVSAVTLVPSRISHHPDAAELMRDIMREGIAVGRREGARLDDSLIEKVIENARAAPPDGMNSLLADRIAGRPMEIDARNGVIVRLGERHSIPTPYNRTVVSLLNAVADTAAGRSTR